MQSPQHGYGYTSMNRPAYRYMYIIYIYRFVVALVLSGILPHLVQSVQNFMFSSTRRNSSSHCEIYLRSADVKGYAAAWVLGPSNLHLCTYVCVHSGAAGR